MASFLEQIKVVIDTDTSKATAGFKNVQQEVTQAEGKFNKLKTAGGGIFDTLKANAGLALAGAGAAIGAFAVSGVGDFEDLAIKVDKFTQKTGVSADAASRWIEVSDDLGISVDTVATAFGKFEKNDAAGKLDEFGLSATTANDRFVEMLGKIQQIPDANDRAAAAFKVFGKSWQELAPLLDSTTNLKQRLDEVSGSKLIDDKEIKKARQFRDDMDRLSDAADNLKLSIGEALLPFLDTLAQIAAPLAEMIGKLQEAKKRADEAPSSASWTDKVVGFFTTTGPQAADFWLNKIDEVTGGTGDRFGQTEDAVAQLGDVVENGSKKFLILRDATMDVSDKTEEQIAVLRRQALAGEESANAMGSSAEAEKEAKKAVDAHNLSLAAQKKYIDDLLSQQEARTNAALGAIGSQRELSKAEDEVATSLANATAKFAEASTAGGTNADKNAAASKAASDLEDQLWHTAASASQLAKDQAEAAGQTFTASEGINAQKNELEKLKQKFPELSPVIDGMINKLNTIPTNKTTDVEIREHGLQDILNRLQNLPHEVFIDVFGKVHVGGAARGGEFSPGEMAWVGEQGKELVAFGDTAKVFSNSQSMNLLKALPWLQDVPGFQTGGYVPDQTYTSGWPFPTTERIRYGKTYQSSMNAVNFGTAFTDENGNTVWSVPVAAPRLPVEARNDLASRGTVINVYMPPGSDGQDVVDALKQYERRNGFVPVRTLAA